MIETFKVIDGYENYMVSNYGKVFCIKRGKFLILNKDRYGYLYVNLYMNGKAKKLKVHRLVAQAFIPNSDNLDTIDHINGIKTDNRVENLQWLSSVDNSKKFHREQKTEEWKRNLYEKVYEVNRKPIICTETGKIYESITQASRELNLKKSNVSKVCKGQLKSTHGLHFEYLLKE